MNLYKISCGGARCYDTYDSAVVAAKTAGEAQRIHPDDKYHSEGTWVPSDQVTVTYLGKAKRGIKSGVVLASFNAG